MTCSGSTGSELLVDRRLSKPAVHQELAVSAPRACVCSSCPAHPAGVSAPPACGFYPSSSLTDAQWAIIEPLLPAPGNTAGRGGRPEKHSRRLVLDAIFYLVRGGIVWRNCRSGSRRRPPSTTGSAPGPRLAGGRPSMTRCAIWCVSTRAATRSPPPRASTPNRGTASAPCPEPPEATTPVSASTDQTSHRC